MHKYTNFIHPQNNPIGACMIRFFNEIKAKKEQTQSDYLRLWVLAIQKVTEDYKCENVWFRNYRRAEVILSLCNNLLKEIDKASDRDLSALFKLEEFMYKGRLTSGASEKISKILRHGLIEATKKYSRAHEYALELDGKQHYRSFTDKVSDDPEYCLTDPNGKKPKY